MRLQWDPDHDPSGAPQERRAIQLGLRGATLEGFEGPALLGIEDITGFVREQRGQRHDTLMTPHERVYPIADPDLRAALRLDDDGAA